MSDPLFGINGIDYRAEARNHLELDGPEIVRQLAGPYGAIQIDFEPGDMTVYSLLIARRGREWDVCLLTCGGGVFRINPDMVATEHGLAYIGSQLKWDNPCTRAAVAAVILEIGELFGLALQ